MPPIFPRLTRLDRHRRLPRPGLTVGWRFLMAALRAWLRLRARWRGWQASRKGPPAAAPAVGDGAARVHVAVPVRLAEGRHRAGEIIAADGSGGRDGRLLWHENWLPRETVAAGNGEDSPRRKS